MCASSQFSATPLQPLFSFIRLLFLMNSMINCGDQAVKSIKSSYLSKKKTVLVGFLLIVISSPSWSGEHGRHDRAHHHYRHHDGSYHVKRHRVHKPVYRVAHYYRPHRVEHHYYRHHHPKPRYTVKHRHYSVDSLDALAAGVLLGVILAD